VLRKKCKKMDEKINVLENAKCGTTKPSKENDAARKEISNVARIGRFFCRNVLRLIDK
jgi:hypothetical protein